MKINRMDQFMIEDAKGSMDTDQYMLGILQYLIRSCYVRKRDFYSTNCTRLFDMFIVYQLEEIIRSNKLDRSQRKA